MLFTSHSRICDIFTWYRPETYQVNFKETDRKKTHAILSLTQLLLAITVIDTGSCKAVDPKMRSDCSFPGITQETCEDKIGCWEIACMAPYVSPSSR